MAHQSSDFRQSPADEEKYKFDPFTHSVTVISEQHRMSHDGFMHHSSGKVTGMVDTNVDEFLIDVPAATFPHLQSFKLGLGRGDIDILVYEGATASADGTPQTSFNTNRNNSNTPGLVLNFAPTITGDGTLIHTGWVPPTATGIGQTSDGIATEGQGEEWILKPSTKYLIRITNNSGATISYRWELLWYEVAYSS